MSERTNALSVLFALAIRAAERENPTVARLMRAAVENYNAEMAKINGTRQ